MNTITQTEEKARGSRDQTSCSAVVETLHQETKGILTAPFIMELGEVEVFDNAQGEKKVSLDEEKSPDFSRPSTALFNKQKQPLTPEQEAQLKRRSLMAAFEQRGFFRQANILNECWTRMIFYECKDCGSVGWSKNHCGMRVCPECADRMKGRLLAKYKKGIAGLSDYHKQRLRLITLTLKNVPELRGPDFNVISLIREAFYRLRLRRPLKRKIYGGIYGIEATNKGKGWHVHIHALISSEFIKDACQEMKEAQNRIEEEKLEREKCSCCKNKCLRRLWQEETGSTVIDIRKANTDGIIEVIGYIAKPLSTKKAELLVDWWEVMRNRPFLKPFGCFYDMKDIKVHLTCPWCGGQKYYVYYGESVRICDLRPDRERSPPLGVDIDNFPKILFIEPSKVVSTMNDRGYEDKVIYLQSNLELLVGTYE